ncbi:MAG TPA: hypothetical protein VLX92_21955 [Kofleriaceae bacterium]|nr:hypothetical protein [Kofleriaceae bacterium]
MWHRAFVFLLAVGCSRPPSSPRPATTAAGMRLAGRVSRPGVNGDQPWRFEIVGFGARSYLRREWGPSFCVVQLVDGSFSGSGSQSGERGGSNHDDSGEPVEAPMLRLWSEPGPHARVATMPHVVEELRGTAARPGVGTAVPRTVLWTDTTSAMPEQTTTYEIDSVSPAASPDAALFARARRAIVGGTGLCGDGGA